MLVVVSIAFGPSTSSVDGLILKGCDLDDFDFYFQQNTAFAVAYQRALEQRSCDCCNSHHGRNKAGGTRTATFATFAPFAPFAPFTTSVFGTFLFCLGAVFATLCVGGTS